MKINVSKLGNRWGNKTFEQSMVQQKNWPSEELIEKNGNLAFWIINPKRDEVYTILPNNGEELTPKMPDLYFEVKIFPLDSKAILKKDEIAFIQNPKINWTLEIGGKFCSGRNAWSDYKEIYEANTTGVQFWKPNFNGDIIGGWAHLVVNILIGKQDIKRDIWFDIQGKNPSKIQIDELIQKEIERYSNRDDFDLDILPKIRRSHA